MKNCILVTLLLIGNFLTAQSTIPEPTRYIAQTATYTTPLTNSERCFYFRRFDGKVEQFQTDLWDGNQFNLSTVRFNNYDANGFLTSDVTRQWDASAGYTDIARTAYTYDPAGNRLSEHFERLNLNTNTWETERTVNSTFSASNKILEQTIINYFNSQMFGNKFTYTYDGSNRLDITIIQNWSNGNWQLQQKTQHQYNDAGPEVDNLFTFTWSVATNDWVPAFRTSHNYQPTTTTAFTEIYNNGVWNNYSSTTHTYNANQQLLSYLYSNYTPQGLQTTYSFYIDYNSDQSILQYRQYRVENQTQYQSLQIDYDYDMYSGVKSAVLQADVQIYPNPTAQFLEVSAPEITAPLMYQVTDVQGRLCSQGTIGQAYAMVDCAALSAGTYFITVSQNNQKKTLAFVKK